MSMGANRVELPLAWVGLDEVPIQFANQFVIQFQPNEFVISIGQATPPAIVGTPDQIAEQIAEVEFVPVRPIARIGLNRDRIVELLAALQANLGNHDQTLANLDPTAPPPS